MLKKGIKLGKILLIIGLLVAGIMILFVLFFRPLQIQGHWIPYTYILHGDSVELVEYCGQEAVVSIPEKIMGRPVTKIGEYCFEGNDVIREVVIPDCVEIIENSAFLRCTNLESIKLPSGLRKISYNTFMSCYELTDVELPNALEEIEDCAFGYCRSMVKIVIPESVQVIGDDAFKQCTSLYEVYIPSGVKKIGGESFANTPWLKTQTSEFVVAGENVLIKYNGNNSKVIIPEGITCIGEEFFSDNEVIEEVHLPQSVREIGFDAFSYNTNLLYVVLENPDVILDEVFIYNCPNVTIVSPEGSTGQAYAETNGIPWMELK